jgi:hypothetical protein
MPAGLCSIKKFAQNVAGKSQPQRQLRCVPKMRCAELLSFGKSQGDGLRESFSPAGVA